MPIDDAHMGGDRRNVAPCYADPGEQRGRFDLTQQSDATTAPLFPPPPGYVGEGL